MPCTIIQSLAEVSGDYDAILCDLWGCFHNGVETYPAAVEACRAFRQRGGLVVLLTNAPRPAASVKRMLDRMGAPDDSYDAIVSSGAACQAALTDGRHGSRFLYVGPDRDLHMLTDLGLEPSPEAEADAILLTGLRDDMTEAPADYAAEVATWAKHRLPVLCANPDIMVDRGHQRLWCAGAIGREYEKIGGTVIWFGKPHAPVYERCREVLSELAGALVGDRRILAIGDGIGTDVKGAVDAGLDAVFVTGGLAGAEFGPDVEQPQQAPLDQFLAEQSLAPRFAIGRLR